MLIRSLFVFTFVLSASGLARAEGPINVVLGDQSWVEAHGAPPGASVPEGARIDTHLRAVQARLESRPVRHLSAQQRAGRHRALAVLAAYRRAGEYPRRTADGYEGRRPRFIDDRGVHCAVGAMIAGTGYAALAAAIDRTQEYAYVPEIRHPGLDAWAGAHGFSTTELAMVQPGYDEPPSESMVRQIIEHTQDAITLRCAKDHPPPSRIRLRVRGDRQGEVRFRARGRNPFAKCFAEAAGMSGGRAYHPAPSRFRFRMRVSIRAPRAILESRLAAMGFEGSATPCIPRPGPIPDRLFTRVRVGAHGVHVAVRTEPLNREVSRCLVGFIEQRLRDFEPGQWRLQARAQASLGRRVTVEGLEQSLPNLLRTAATECFAEGAPERVSARVLGELDAEAFVAVVEGGSEAFGACVAEQLQTSVAQVFRVSREVAPGRYEPFVRVDADVGAEATVEVESPAAREERNRRALEAMEREIHLH